MGVRVGAFKYCIVDFDRRSPPSRPPARRALRTPRGGRRLGERGSTAYEQLGARQKRLQVPRRPRRR